MADHVIHISPEDTDVIDDLSAYLEQMPDVARPVQRSAQTAFNRIEQMLYTAPSFINAIQAAFPEEVLQAVFTDEQRTKIAKGALKLMTKKDGTLMATLINAKSKKISQQISLKSVKATPELSQAIASFSIQMQLAQIAQEIHQVQQTIEEVCLGQKSDRLALAYSCRQKLFQLMRFKDRELKKAALLQVISDAEDSRQRLMFSQRTNLQLVERQPKSMWRKVLNGGKQETIDKRLEDIKESLGAINIVSLVQAMSYQELGETEAAEESLRQYAQFLEEEYLGSPELIQRLDSMSSSTENYLSTNLPSIKKRIQALSFSAEEENVMLRGEKDYEE